MQDLTSDNDGRWANIDFLERLPMSTNANDQKSQLQEEIKRLKEEKSSFGLELDKAQQLLKL